MPKCIHAAARRASPPLTFPPVFDPWGVDGAKLLSEIRAMGEPETYSLRTRPRAEVLRQHQSLLELLPPVRPGWLERLFR
jgi:hypothetical protein